MLRQTYFRQQMTYHVGEVVADVPSYVERVHTYHGLEDLKSC